MMNQAERDAALGKTAAALAQYYDNLKAAGLPENLTANIVLEAAKTLHITSIKDGD